MKTFLLSLAIIVLLPFSSVSQNLILNHSADDSLIGGNIPHWQEEIGTGWTQRCASPVPFAGNCYFFPGAVSIGELTQDIDVSNDSIAIDNGNKYYFFNGYVRSYAQSPSDESNIIIRFYDAVDTVLTTYSFGPFTSTASWLQVDSTMSAPNGARKVSITLRSVRKSGSNNDGYYDELYLGDSILTSLTHIDDDVFSIYPNPSLGEITISLTKSNSKFTTLIVTDLMGRKLNELKLNSTITSIDLDYPKGIYLVTLHSDFQIYTRKIIIY